MTTGEPGTDATVTNTGSDNAAVLNFTIPRGAKGEKGIQGVKGDPGEKGEKGETGAQGSPGAAATVQVGTVTTGEAGTSASVVNRGTENAAILDFVIPKGDKGDAGTGGSSGGITANDVYPVNSVKIWYDNEDHSNFLGSQWQRCAEGRAAVGIAQGDADFGTIGKQLGEKTHSLTTAEAPPIGSGDYLITSGITERYINGYNGSNGQPHNNIQPSEVMAFWRRIS